MTNATEQAGVAGMLKTFLKLESSGGIILMASAALAILIANTPLSVYYDIFIDTPVEVRIGTLEIAKPLFMWVNDGLMAIFFFLIGLELKREILEGELSTPSDVFLPAIGALGGIIFPIGFYYLVNKGDPTAMQGWAIPAATDIAFALGILMLLGPRVPLSLKVFLASLAIFDDIGAIVIIAIFYTTQLSALALSIAGGCLVILSYMSWRNVSSVAAYLLVGLIMWAAVLKSGVHATLAGVALAAFIPMKDAKNPDRSPLRELEHDLHTTVALGVLPIFAFVNAGISFDGLGMSDLAHPVSLGIILGLFVGKQLGVFALCGIAIKMGWAKLPDGAGWGGLYGVSVLAGVGFTMSLFIGGLAYESVSLDERSLFDERLGILVGSILSGVVGYLVLYKALPRED